MPTATIDGITTAYEVIGSGPPLLLCSPGGFDAAAAKWRTLEIYRETRILDQLAERFSCIVYDRRESGASGGRVEAVTWEDYATQARGLLDHLGIDRAHVMGGCMGCSVATAFAVAHPSTVERIVLFWPVGGAPYRSKGRQRFDEHLAFVDEHGLEGVAKLAAGTDAGFGQDPRIGPWGSVVRRDEAFAEAYRGLDPGWYDATAREMVRGLLDRDTSPGAEPEGLRALAAPTLIVPGQDASHATSAARYLEEQLPGADYWDAPVSAQTEAAVGGRVLAFLTAER